jgi:hypothetical protein
MFISVWSTSFAPSFGYSPRTEAHRNQKRTDTRTDTTATPTAPQPSISHGSQQCHDQQSSVFGSMIWNAWPLTAWLGRSDRPVCVRSDRIEV